MIWFLDTSALVKRYANEKGSHWLRREIKSHKIEIAQITIVEMSSAMKRKFRNREVSQIEVYRARHRFLQHVSNKQYRVTNLSDAIVKRAAQLAFVRDLRAYDAIQLATALVAAQSSELNRFFFITADSHLENVSIEEGLQTLNPLNF